MKKSRFGLMWFHEWNRAAFVIDLASWGIKVKVGASWEVQVLCFHLQGL